MNAEYNACTFCKTAAESGIKNTKLRYRFARVLPTTNLPLKSGVHAFVAQMSDVKMYICCAPPRDLPDEVLPAQLSQQHSPQRT
ncbi:hypothetical protein SAMN06273572_102406 [Monaibacterium marinum]|uniref:Uncharacterized protein n=1 Tax=Pontivivens marinum TaxID=1690039 RepID=A0A2C9CR97_9RHOB|nr:hypothetical protein SAMN06273572_102406 [Monaibacterium marinum]